MTLSADIAPAILRTNDLNLSPKENPEVFDDPYWKPLRKSGFNIGLHLKKLQIDSLRLLRENKAWKEVAEFCVEESTAEVRGFWQEFFHRFSVLPIPIEKRRVNGKEEIVISYSENQLFLGAIEEKEREGAVKASFIRITEFLKNAPEGSMAILISPPGWSNLQDGAGRLITYLDTQIYGYRITKGKIEALTIITDNTLEADEDLFARLAGQELPPAVRKKERIKNVAGSPIFIGNNDNALSFEQLLDEVEFVKGSPLARGKVTFAELKKQLAEKDRLLEGSQAIKTLIAKLEEDLEFCLVDPSTNSFLEAGRKIADALVRLHIVSSEVGPVEEVDWHYLNDLLVNESRRRQAMEQISALTGCSGGGLATMVVWGPNGPRVVGVEKKGRFRHCGGCSKGRGRQEFESEEGRICANAVPV